MQGSLNLNITQLQNTCTDVMFMFAGVDVYNVFFNGIFLWCATFKILGGFMKWGVRNKTAEKRLKMAIFKLLVLSYMHTKLYFFILLFEKYEQVVCCVKVQEKV